MNSKPPRLEQQNAPTYVRACGVVVVDADRGSSEFLRASLPESEFEVVHVATIEGALREVRATARVLAVVDDDLPLVRGLDLLGRLRAERSDLESVLMTRDDGIATFATRLTVERFRCLKKPFRIDDLRAFVIEGVQRLIRRRRPRDYERHGDPDDGVRNELERRIEALERASRNVSHVPAPPQKDEDETPSEQPAVEGDGLHVLVVDDDPLVRNAMARTFKRHHVTTAENGRAATREIELHKPDIIISDLKMPEMDGIELAEQIQERWPDLSSRIVFVSGTNSQIERARKIAPQQPLLTKPVSNKQLEARIAEVLEAAIRRR